MKTKLTILVLLIIFTASAASAIEIEKPISFELIAEYGNAYLERAKTSSGGVNIIHLKGTHYEMGKQYGALLGTQIIESSKLINLKTVMPDEFPEEKARAVTEGIWKLMEPHVPAEFMEEIRGVIDGAKETGVSIDKIDLITPIVIANISDMHNKGAIAEAVSAQARLGELAYTCSAFAAWGDRTVGGKTFSSRVLDWRPKTGTDKYKLVTVYEPVDEKGQPLAAYVVADYAGFLGAINGMNEHGITVSEIGSENTVEKLNGMPWTLMFRKVLENSTNLNEAFAVIVQAENTIGYNFVLGDGDADNYGTPGWTPGGVAVEENGSFTMIIREDDPIDRNAVWIDSSGKPVLQNGRPVHYGTPLKNAVLRADIAMYPKIRKTQTADNGPGNEDSDGNPLTGGSYKKRHLSQYNAILALEKGTAYSNPYTDKQVFEATGKKRLIGPNEALEIAASAAIPGSSVMSVVYAATDLEIYISWESTAGDKWSPSFENPYVHLSMKELLSRGKQAPSAMQ